MSAAHPLKMIRNVLSNQLPVEPVPAGSGTRCGEDASWGSVTTCSGSSRISSSPSSSESWIIRVIEGNRGAPSKGEALCKQAVVG